MADGTQFRHRVHVLTEVIDDADEIELITTVFQRRGWVVRGARSGEACGYPAMNRTWLVVEVRFNGYPRTAPKVAAKQIEEVAEKLKLGVWVRYAEIISFSREPGKTYYIDENPAPWLSGCRLLSRALRLAGVPRTIGLIRLPTSAKESDARDELARFNLGRPFDASRNSVRPEIPDLPQTARRATLPEPPGWPIRLAAAAGMVLAVVCGVAAVWAPGAWKAIPVVIGLATTVPGARWMSADRTLALRIGGGFALAGSAMFLGVIYGSAVKPSAIIGSGLIAVALILIGMGVILALRDSGVAGQLWWLLPLAVTVLAPVVLALGGTFDAEYLNGGFGISADTVSAPAVMRLAIAGSSILIGLSAVLVLVAVIGWVRYFHGLDDVTRPLLVLGVICVAITYLLSSVSWGISQADAAARTAAAQARAGRQPAAYFGLRGVLECVQPTTSPLPVYNGPLPVERPVLSFGTTGTQLWVWDPRTARAISVPLQDIAAIPATGTPARC